MFDRKPKLAGPSLLDRIEKAGARRVAILGLHPHAGARMVLQSLVTDIHKKGEPLAVTSAPRLPLEQEEGADRQPVTRVNLPAGSYIASSAGLAEEGGATLDQVETTEYTTVLGRVAIHRLSSAGEVQLHGPGETAEVGTRKIAEESAEAGGPRRPEASGYIDIGRCQEGRTGIRGSADVRQHDP